MNISKLTDGYTTFTSNVVKLGNTHINELSIYGIKALTIEMEHDNLVFKATEPEASIRLVRRAKCLIINEEKPPFEARYEIEDSFIEAEQAKSVDLETYLSVLADHIELKVAQARKEHDETYDETKMISATSWQVIGTALDLNFFNLNSKECTVTVHNKTSHFRSLQNTGILIAPFSKVYIKKGLTQIKATEVVYSSTPV